MLEIKNTVKMKDAFDGLISRLDMAEISELEDIAIEPMKTEMQKEYFKNIFKYFKNYFLVYVKSANCTLGGSIVQLLMLRIWLWITLVEIFSNYYL